MAEEMRSLYLKDKDLLSHKTFEVIGDDHNHLKNVLRIAVGERVLLLNGRGVGVLTKVSRIEKKLIALVVEKVATPSNQLNLDVILSLSKREALEESILICIEAGVKNILLTETEYSQRREVNWDRIESLVKSSIEQSNSFFRPEIKLTPFQESTFSKYQQVVVFNILNDSTGDQKVDGSKSETALFVGPEGGFSIKDLNLLKSLKNLSQLEFKTPVFRAEHAVAVGIGWYIAQSASYKIG